MKRLVVAAVLAAATATIARADDPAALFQSKCKICHGPDGKGSPAGQKLGVKDLTAVKLSEADATKVIQNGQGKMTPFKGRLSDDEIRALAGFVARGLK